jgi:hypothetical protein
MRPKFIQFLYKRQAAYRSTGPLLEYDKYITQCKSPAKVNYRI